jgi:uncharacterized protein YbjT (DUF2867 family)
MTKPIVAVVGSTGAQAGGLVDAILASNDFAVRAITRKPDSDKGKALAARGAEVVAADLDDEASLVKAFAGAHGAFCVTNFWEHFSVEKEQAQARNLANAAKKAGVKHAIWSTLEDTRKRVPLDDPRMPTLYGKYKVPQHDGKGESDRFFRDAGVPTTFLLTSFYWDNLLSPGMAPKKGDDGKLGIVLPTSDKKLAGIAVVDIGRSAFGIFKRPDLIDKTVGVMGEALTGDEMAAQMSRALGKEIVYRYVSPEVYRSFGFPGADDLGNMFQYYRDFADEFTAARDVSLVRQLNPQLQTFAQFLELNARKIPLE